MLRGRRLVEDDLDGHALNDLHEVAGRVLGRSMTDAAMRKVLERGCQPDEGMATFIFHAGTVL